MKTTDLIDALSADLPATGVARLRVRLWIALGMSAIVAAIGVWTVLGFRSDLAAAMVGPTFWAKAAYTVAVGAAGLWLLDRAGRPGADVRGPLLLLATIAILVILAGSISLMTTPQAGRMAAVMGGSARVCPTNVAGLSLLAAPFILFAARRFAPPRPGLAGAATGLLAGGVAATFYGLHCPEHTAAFVAVWYTLGMAIPVAIGAAIGRLVWRW